MHYKFKIFLLVILAKIFDVFEIFHKIDEGHVGVYYHAGALMPIITRPGLHIKLPWITTLCMIQVTMQTDAIVNVTCGTSGGVMISFDRIEIVHILTAEHGLFLPKMI